MSEKIEIEHVKNGFILSRKETLGAIPQVFEYQEHKEDLRRQEKTPSALKATQRVLLEATKFLVRSAPIPDGYQVKIVILNPSGREIE